MTKRKNQKAKCSQLHIYAAIFLLFGITLGCTKRNDSNSSVFGNNSSGIEGAFGWKFLEVVPEKPEFKCTVEETAIIAFNPCRPRGLKGKYPGKYKAFSCVVRPKEGASIAKEITLCLMPKSRKIYSLRVETTIEALDYAKTRQLVESLKQKYGDPTSFQETVILFNPRITGADYGWNLGQNYVFLALGSGPKLVYDDFKAGDEAIQENEAIYRKTAPRWDAKGL